VFFHCFYYNGKRPVGIQVTRIGCDQLYYYTGQFSLKTGLYEGKGVLYNCNGHKYKGEFKAGLKHGEGLYETESENYNGNFFEGEQHGKGCLIYKDGRI
jgi:hypothetical protein